MLPSGAAERPGGLIRPAPSTFQFRIIPNTNDANGIAVIPYARSVHGRTAERLSPKLVTAFLGKRELRQPASLAKDTGSYVHF